jgi:hypothetical protein
MRKHFISLALAAVFTLAFGPATASAGSVYTVTVTNLTRGQPFSPPVIAAHSSETGIFTAGWPASEELASVAEEGDGSGLMDLLSADPEVNQVVVGDAVIMPGQSASFEIESKGTMSLLSVVGMLGSTNDAFYGLDSYSLSGITGQGSMVLEVPGYDAGSEVNSEDCDYIPGPPCGNPGVRDTEGAEGYIQVHAGIHGIGDLDPSVKDWRNPVGHITIERN